MTVIAWDGRTLAADRLIDDNGARGEVTKIERLEDGSLIGRSGDMPRCIEIADFVKGLRDSISAPQNDEFGRVIHITKNGILIYINSITPIKIECSQWATGSGRDFALAAMHLGYSATEAVKLAIKLCASCGGGVNTLEFK